MGGGLLQTSFRGGRSVKLSGSQDAQHEQRAPKVSVYPGLHRGLFPSG